MRSDIAGMSSEIVVVVYAFGHPANNPGRRKFGPHCRKDVVLLPDLG